MLQGENNLESSTVEKEIDMLVSEKKVSDKGRSELDSDSSSVLQYQRHVIRDEKFSTASEDIKQIPPAVNVHDSAIVVKQDEHVIKDTVSEKLVESDTAAVKQDICDTNIEVKCKLDSERQEKPDQAHTAQPTEPSPQIAVELYSDSSAQKSQTESETGSNLDKEIARLNSYLSQTSGCSFSDLESSTKSEPQSLSSSLSAKKEVENILLKDTRMTSQRYNDLEDEITRNYGKTLNEYKESDLDKQLKQLDFEASSSGLGTAKSPVLSPAETSPSIYSLYKTPSISQDDFYSSYTPKSLDSMSSESSFNSPLERQFSDPMSESIHILDTPHNPSMGKSVNMWTEITAQGNMLSLCASSTHVWYTDKSTNIWYSSLTGPGLPWRKASGYASQISVSRSGTIVWRLYKGVAYAGTKITAKCPEGLKWVQSVQGDVAYICVDDTCAW